MSEPDPCPDDVLAAVAAAYATDAATIVGRSRARAASEARFAAALLLRFALGGSNSSIGRALRRDASTAAYEIGAGLARFSRAAAFGVRLRAALDRAAPARADAAFAGIAAAAARQAARDRGTAAK